MARIDHGAIYRKGAAHVLMEEEAELLAERELELAGYGRISDDQEDEKTGDRGAGVARQREAVQQVCKLMSITQQPLKWTIKVWFEDNDVSAFKDVVRPQFELMLDALRRGDLEGIVVYDLDRLARRPVDLEKVIDIYDKAAKEGRRMHFATAQDKIDLASADGLTLARVMVAFANKASRDTARRVALKHREVALTGRPVGGTRPFGWKWTDGKKPLTLKDGRVIPAGKRQHVVVDDEAKIIQQAAQDVLLGVSLTTICRDLNERGSRTTRGNEWRPGPLRLMLESPRLAGFRVHQGTFIAKKDGTGFVVGEWDPILDENTWHQMHAALMARGSEHRKNEGHRTYLLAGVLRCSECGGTMHGNARRNGSYFYACRPGNGSKGKAGCGKVSASGQAVDELVDRLMRERMLLGTVEVHEEETWPFEKDLAAAKERMQALVPQLTDTVGEARMLLNAEFTKLSDQVEEMRAERARWVLKHGRSVRHASVGPEDWDGMTIEMQRAYVKEELTTIVVRPADRRSNRFDYKRLEIVWRTDEPGAA